MAFTRAQLRDRTAKLADIDNSPRWDFTAGTGDVDVHGGVEHWRSWRRILNASPYERVAMYTPTTDASGAIALTDLTDTSTPDQSKILYRVLLVAFNNRPYKEMAGEEQFMATVTGQFGQANVYGSWFRSGSTLVVPDALSAQATGVWVNHIPTRVDLLSSDDAVVEYPDGYEDVLCFRWAATLLRKGAAEADAADYLDNQANTLEAEMLQDLSRTSIKPWVMRFPDASAEWAGMGY